MLFSFTESGRAYDLQRTFQGKRQLPTRGCLDSAVTQNQGLQFAQSRGIADSVGQVHYREGVDVAV